ncbi:hypothetical protein CC1G_05687 [Coprinopsis cinerea okayama7|uniref:Uncharacterized protein n=1 Tax=Coprinopsis cinerea (strain Okayama-7 / 130 / ATCC MYA-4618 / FGSC 9003) TaxID=240176 RepID=A8N9W0_COPC7|nr:hypothetical protein CC1G_05687 [Coprinopsis cinerea okayama7\|eukprot:XP_001831616.2 hypothetical protein CC1G_05687 [Coprinopsis cinerea okayama7\
MTSDFDETSFTTPFKLESLRLRNYYEPVLNSFFCSPRAVDFSHLRKLDVCIIVEDKYITCIRLLAAAERLETLKIILNDCVEVDNHGQLPFPLAYIRPTSYATLKHLSLTNYHFVESPISFTTQFVGLCDGRSSLLRAWPRPSNEGWEEALEYGDIPEDVLSMALYNELQPARDTTDHSRMARGVSMEPRPPIVALIYVPHNPRLHTLPLRGFLSRLELGDNWSILDKLLGGFDCNVREEPSINSAPRNIHTICRCSHSYAFPHLHSVSLRVILLPITPDDMELMEEDAVILEQHQEYKRKLEKLLECRGLATCDCGGSTNWRMKPLESYWKPEGDLVETSVSPPQDPRPLFPLLRSRVFHERSRGFNFTAIVNLKEKVYPMDGGLPRMFDIYTHVQI